MNIAYFTVLSISFVVAIFICTQKPNPGRLKWFALFTGIVLTIELGNFYLYFPLVHHSNHYIFNIESVFEFYFFSWFFYRTLTKKNNKFLIKCFVWIYPLILAGSFLTVQEYFSFHTYTYILGEIYLVILCILYYHELYHSNDIKPLSSQPDFWIVTGLFIFSAGELPYMMLLHYLNNNFVVTSFYFREYILGTLNIAMNAMFIIGLLCSIQTRK